MAKMKLGNKMKEVKMHEEVPTWARSLVLNYRYAFKEKYGRDAKITDADVFHIYNTVFDDTDTLLEDGARVDAMLAKEQK